MDSPEIIPKNPFSRITNITDFHLHVISMRPATFVPFYYSLLLIIFHKIRSEKTIPPLIDKNEYKWSAYNFTSYQLVT